MPNYSHHSHDMSEEKDSGVFKLKQELIIYMIFSYLI